MGTNTSTKGKQIKVWMSESDAAYLDAMARDGGWRCRSTLVRSLLRSIIEDDQEDARNEAHVGGAALP